MHVATVGSAPKSKAMLSTATRHDIVESSPESDVIESSTAAHGHSATATYNWG